MALHEMGTNALKYGSLSVPEGRVEISWSLEGEETSALFRIGWTETGGPAVTPPRRQGFGSRIITDVPRAKLDARIETVYGASGFRWSLECALASVS
jgi:two-component sensor histidine kinase